MSTAEAEGHSSQPYHLIYSILYFYPRERKNGMEKSLGSILKKHI